MSRYTIVLWDHEYDLKFQLGAFDRIPGGWWKFSSWFKWNEGQFNVAQTSLTKYLKADKEEKKSETKRKPNKAKKSKKPARKSRKVR